MPPPLVPIKTWAPDIRYESSPNAALSPGTNEVSMNCSQELPVGLHGGLNWFFAIFSRQPVPAKPNRYSPFLNTFGSASSMMEPALLVSALSPPIRMEVGVRIAAITVMTTPLLIGHRQKDSAGGRRIG